MEKRTKFENTDSKKPNSMFSTRGTGKIEDYPMTESERVECFARKTLTKVKLLPLQ